MSNRDIMSLPAYQNKRGYGILPLLLMSDFSHHQAVESFRMARPTRILMDSTPDVKPIHIQRQTRSYKYRLSPSHSRKLSFDYKNSGSVRTSYLLVWSFDDYYTHVRHRILGPGSQRKMQLHACPPKINSIQTNNIPRKNTRQSKANTTRVQLLSKPSGKLMEEHIKVRSSIRNFYQDSYSIQDRPIARAPSALN